MKSQSKRKHAKEMTAAALASALALTVLGLSGAAEAGLFGGASNVRCMNVTQSASGYLVVPAGICDKLADATSGNAAAEQPTQTGDVPVVMSGAQVKCFGVAAPGKNDCGTSMASCAGTVKTARAADAWIALPTGVCSQLTGSTSQAIQSNGS